MRLEGESYAIDVGTFVMNYHHGLLRFGVVKTKTVGDDGWSYFDVRFFEDDIHERRVEWDKKMNSKKSTQTHPWRLAKPKHWVVAKRFVSLRRIQIWAKNRSLLKKLLMIWSQSHHPSWHQEGSPVSQFSANKTKQVSGRVIEGVVMATGQCCSLALSATPWRYYLWQYEWF